MTRHRALLESDLLSTRLCDLHRRRARDRGSGRTQSRHDRRRAVSGGPLGGSLGGLRRGGGADGDPRTGRRARARHARVLSRALPHGDWRRRDADRDQDPAHRRIRQRLREGRPARRRLGGRGRRRVHLAGRTARSRTPGSPWLRSAPTSPAQTPSGSSAARSRPRSCSPRPPRQRRRNARPSQTSADHRSTSGTPPAC